MDSRDEKINIEEDIKHLKDILVTSKVKLSEIIFN